VSPWCAGAAWALAHHDVPGSTAQRWDQCALRAGWPINGESFAAYVDQVLVPTLHSGDVVVMDNLASHKSVDIRKAIHAAGARLLFLPRCLTGRRAG
jgi:DDE superfamily endonuclease